MFLIDKLIIMDNNGIEVVVVVDQDSSDTNPQISVRKSDHNVSSHLFRKKKEIGPHNRSLLNTHNQIGIDIHKEAIKN